MITVHLIGNAHLDPVWLWPWQRGADEAVATCRSACDILDRYPFATFTRGEAWVYEQVRRLDPSLLRRIRGHIDAGRWEVVNGWWVQADTNLPSHDALRATARLGRDWFARHLGVADIPVGYLVDTFGHGAYLPSLLRETGQECFVFMRPGPHERTLPSHLFRWRAPDGAEIPAFRIHGAYLCAAPGSLAGHIEGAVADARAAGHAHAMCFYGVGNHGGGPSRRLVEWLDAHRDFAPDVRLEFSTVRDYFEAVAAEIPAAPLVEGELQMHAIGCYSVCSGLKRDLRDAELALLDAERLSGESPAPRCGGGKAAGPGRMLDEAWRTVCFNQFHDLLPGSSIASATAAARRQTGGAREAAEALAYDALRARSLARAEPAGHRLHVVNRADVRWTGLAEAEIPLDGQSWHHHLEDAGGRVVPHQTVPPECLMRESASPIPFPRLLLPVDLPPRAALALRIVPDAAGAAAAAPPPAKDGAPFFAPSAGGPALSNGLLAVSFGPDGIAMLRDPVDGAPLLARPITLNALADGSDTWSHGIDRYAGPTGPLHAVARFEAPEPVESGGFRATVLLRGRLGSSPCRLFVSLDRDDPFVHCRLDVNYQEPMTVFKASIGLPGPVAARRDRVGGGWIDRAADGAERPLHHALRVESAGRAYGVLLPDSFAVDVTARSIRPTLLRNSLHAYHSCARIPADELPGLFRRFGTDEGPVSLRFSLCAASTLDDAGMEQALARLQRPPWTWDDYRDVSRVARFDAAPVS
ncbi:MAG: hypothetical protein ACOX5G_05660 [Kiritimatiellia bacterium]|jgi:alpha-mannosidase